MTRKIGGLLVLIISFIVYLLTLEPTTSMWDCSEFIACAYGLEVGHAPGAPVFMLLGRFFSLFALDPSQAAFMINLLSATASAFTIFFLFHTIYWFGQKLLQQTNHNFSASFLQQVLTMAAFLGAMSFAFTDTFWFSAVEGEVYATSSLFTAVVFWSIIRWEQDNSQYADRWLLLIFFLLGLSVGVHLLNLLALPAVALVYYFKKFERSTKGIIITLALSVLLMVIIIFGFIPGVVAFTAHTDRLFVNTFGLPVYSGALFFIFLLTGGVLYAIHHYRKKGKITMHFIALAFALWLAGYSSFTMLIIRSNQ
ncbi:glycosyltransferase family 117 protein, partial [Salinivirga cyanobacteriivorans]